MVQFPMEVKKMSYETVIDQVKTLPEEFLEEASTYLTFLIYKSNWNKMKVIAETDEECNSKMQKGYDDMIQGKVKPLKEAVSDIKKRFAWWITKLKFQNKQKKTSQVFIHTSWTNCVHKLSPLYKNLLIKPMFWKYFQSSSPK